MFKYHISGGNSKFDEIRQRFNDKPFFYRARVWITSDILYWYLSRKQNKND